MVAPIVLVLWIALIVGVIRGKSAVRAAACVVGTALAVWCCVLSHRIGKASAWSEFLDEVSRPMLWYAHDMEQLTLKDPTVHARAKGFREAWWAYVTRREDFGAAISALNMDDIGTDTTTAHGTPAKQPPAGGGHARGNNGYP